MAKFSNEELLILTRALDAYPQGIDSPDDYESVEYAAFVRLYEAGLIASEIEPLFQDGRERRAQYLRCTITEAGRDVLDDINQKPGEVDADDAPILLGLKEGREIIIRHVRNVHGASNELGIRITIEEIDEAEAQVRKSGPKVVKRLLTEWVPSSLTSSTMKMLIDIVRSWG